MSKPKYNKFYQENNYFGKPYKEFINFFADHMPKGTILDLGCGQGRDSLALAKLGYKVTGIDISDVGINQMLEISNMLGYEVEGIVGDIFSYKNMSSFDVVLLDSMVHFYKADKEKESAFIINVVSELKSEGVFCNLMVQSKKKEQYLKDIINDLEYNWQILKDEYVSYPEANVKYHMYIIKKVSK